MFPYDWNGFGMNTASPFAAPLAVGMLSRRREDLIDLPEEVRESLEEHRDEFKSEDDISHFVNELDLKK